MPSVITHYLLAERVLSRFKAEDREAFLIGAQGPDLFFFFRAYPWLVGKSGFPLGNELHEMDVSVLLDAMRRQAAYADETHRAAVNSYICGFLCHYAVDRTIHPLILFGQQRLKENMPAISKTDEPYHFYYESALDTLFLRQECGRSVRRFQLTNVIPNTSSVCEEAIAAFYECLLPTVSNERYTFRQLRRLAKDMRHSMWWMTDHTGLKRHLIRTAEILLGRDATFSSLVRTEKLTSYDFFNKEHSTFWTDEYGACNDDFECLCERAVLLALSLIQGFWENAPTEQLTDHIAFAGHRMCNGGESK